MRDNNPSSFGWGDNPLISITAKIDYTEPILVLP
jgi:hypothetical protein